MNDRLEIFFEAMENECYDKSDSNSGEKQSKEQQDEFADGPSGMAEVSSLRMAMKLWNMLEGC